jgi:hypothetical protein
MAPFVLLLQPLLLISPSSSSQSAFSQWSPPRMPCLLRKRTLQWRASSEKGTKLITFVGKGGSGKTVSAILAAQYYASNGLRTCLLIQSQDPTADVLLGVKLGSTPSSFREGALTALRLETTKMLIEPLAQIRKADARLNFSQGALDEVVFFFFFFFFFSLSSICHPELFFLQN